MNIDRRQLIALGTLGVGALAAPAAATLSGANGFTHGVASGEPTAESVLLWTRFVGNGESKLTAELSSSADFNGAKIVGEVNATAERDFTAKITAHGLDANRWYFYRFVAPDGTKSATGRTRTLPIGSVSKFNLGVVGCSNIAFGYFNAYAHAAQNGDLDLMIHTGDYLYEYGPGIYPSAKQQIDSRVPGPTHELIALADYRLRYAAYRKDPDLQRLHQVLPMLAMWDDHEFANDAYRDGAQNHDPAKEGDWEVRKRVAEQVYREWMPVSDVQNGQPLWDQYQIGDLATIFLTESRISGRDKPADLAEAIKGQGDVTQALTKFRDEVWQDPSRSMLGDVQEAWLASAMKTSKASGTKWQIMAQQCVMGEIKLPQAATAWIAEDAPAIARSRVGVGTLASKLGLPLNFDAWDGYPQARKRILDAAQQADADLIVLSGDSHNGWAFDLDAGNGAVGVEFGGHSVASPGFESFTAGVDPASVARTVVEENDQLQWANTENRGYMTVSLTPDKATSTWHFLDTVRQKSIAMKGSESRSVVRRSNELQTVS